MKRALLLAIPLLLAVFAVPVGCGVSATSEWWVVIVGGVELGQYQLLFDSFVCHFTMVQHFGINPETNIQYLYVRPAEQIGEVDNATTKQNVGWTIDKWLKNHSDEDDNVFIYFACHGGGAYANGTLEGGRIDLSGDEGREHQYSDGTWYGVDECVYLGSTGIDETYWDDELAEDLSGLQYQALIVMFQSCKSTNASCPSSCFSGGFIDDLSALSRIIISASNETGPAYVDLDGDCISEFSEGFFEALYGYDMSVNMLGVTVGKPINADSDGDQLVSFKEAFNYAYEHDAARWVVGYQIDSETGCPIDESPWFDDDNNGLPTFKAGYDIFLLGDFNFDGQVNGEDLRLFIDGYYSAYHPLYDLDDDFDIDGYDLKIFIKCYNAN